MTSALLKSISIKKQLYKQWIKTDVNNVELYFRLKEEFKSYYNERQILAFYDSL